MVLRHHRLLFPAALCGILIAFGCLLASARPAASTTNQEPGQPSPIAQQLGPVIEMPKPEPLDTWAPDGIISADEYAHQADYGNLELHWTNYYQYVYAAIRVRNAAWVALGIPPESGTGNTDIIYGTISEGNAIVYDMFSSTGDFSARQLDTAPGGANNIQVFGGSNERGYTVIEFRRAFSTNDQYDSQFLFPATGITWAYGSDTETVTEQGQGELALLYYACPEYIC